MHDSRVEWAWVLQLKCCMAVYYRESALGAVVGEYPFPAGGIGSAKMDFGNFANSFLANVASLERG